jgi:cell division protease FtsH
MTEEKNMPDSAQPENRNNAFGGRTLVWIIVLSVMALYMVRGLDTPEGTDRISYTDFKEAVDNDHVEEVVIRGDLIEGRFNGAGTANNEPQRFTTVIPAIDDPELIELLESRGVKIRAESTQNTWVQTLMIAFLPWLLIIGLFIYLGRRMQNRMGGAQDGLFGFSRSKAKLFSKENVTTLYSDVAGLENAKKELQEIVDFLKDSKHFRKLGATLPKGILLVGPPGVGKTLMAQATAGEANVPFYSISGSEFIEMFVGVGASRVRDLFKRAKQSEPAIIFIDEIDSIGRVRGTGLGGGHDEREQTLNQILAEMDGFSPRRSIVVMAATNRPDVLDPALIRPGRFDRQITLDLPQKQARHEILKTHVRHVPLAQDMNLALIAERTVGFSGADLKNLVNEAALIAARQKKDQVAAEDFDKARDKILMGIEREDVISAEEKQVVAYHEAGHALLAKMLPGADPLQKVSIIPRGRSLGVTEQLPEEDRYNLKQSYLLNRIAIMLGGRAAEKIIFKETSTGSSDDLKRATQIARRMVCEWGMSEKLGPATFSQTSSHPFLGRELSEPKDFSEHTARLIDEEISRILQEAEEVAEDLLKKNEALLVKLAEALLDHETLSRKQVEMLIAGDPVVKA